MKTVSGSNIVRVKSHNRQAILLALLNAPASRVELAKTLNITSMTVTNIVSELINEGWVCLKENETAVSRKKAGRPRETLQINPEAGYVISVHIGIGILRIGIVNLCGELILLNEQPFDITLPATAVLKQIASEIKTIYQQSTIPNHKIFGIGVGSSGLIDAQNGICVTAPSLQWHHVEIAQQLKRLTGFEVRVENNVRAMALGEAHFGAGQNVSLCAMIYGRIGVGAGFVLNNELFRGVKAGAGEIGHTIIQPDSTIQCRCGQFGCLETIVTQPILESKLSQSKYAPLHTIATEVERFDYILNLAKEGDPFVQTQMQLIANYLSIAMINLVNTLNPEQIILGGMYAQGAEQFLPFLQESVRQKAFGGLGQHVQIVAAQNGLQAGVIGAASIALMAFFYKGHISQN
ncbi:MAG: ROK family transcriptional regulator [Chloroflexota bacterium]